MGLNMKDRVAADKCDWYTVSATALLRGLWLQAGAERGLCWVHGCRPADRPTVLARPSRPAACPPAPSPCPAPQGPPLFELLDGIEAAQRDVFAPFRMPIMDRYR